MVYWGLPDWKKVGWHIGKGMKDILNPCPAEPEESEKQREARRQSDGLKGFVYFERFDELWSWSPRDIDPVQQANTPLLDRPEAPDGQPKAGANVLLCHDYSGGFHDYESVRPVATENEVYTCHYLQYVEVLIYFSHKLVCVPPSPWINTMHRNGVAILGTFIFEPQTPNMEKVLEQVDGEYVIARRLADLASTFGFDGWLLNFEQNFPTSDRKLVFKLLEFVSQLRRLIGLRGKVIWYDALNIDNEVEYQNSLTTKNLDFARSAQALFTNYKWTEAMIEEASKFAAQHHVIPSDVYFGVDVWAQNTNMPGPPRITFPPKGGGGTNTGLAVKTIVHEGFAAAIFAPGWPYEHFPTSPHPRSPSLSQISIARAVERSMWEGASLPNNLGCDCLKGKPHHVAHYKSHPIIKYAQEHPCGSSAFFYTNFQEGLRRVMGEKSNLFVSNLGSQSILPHLLSVPAPEWEEMGKTYPTRVMYGELENSGTPHLRIMTKMLSHLPEDIIDKRGHRLQHSQTTEMMRLQLFKLNMPADDTLEAHIKYECNQTCRLMDIGFFTTNETQQPICLEDKNNRLLYTGADEPSEIRFSLQSDNPEARVVGLGVYCTGPFGSNETSSLITVSSITIKKKGITDDAFNLGDIRVVERGKSPKMEKRLAWSWRGSREGSVEGVPWSGTTGPFSHFVVIIDGKEVGVAYCLEFPLREGDCDLSRSKSITIQARIEGVLFDGGRIQSSTTMIPLEELIVENTQYVLD